MKILLDHCVPRRFRQVLPGHEVKTAFEMGWAGLKNGALLAQAAADGFDVFVTVDQNIRFQQNLSLLPLSVVILVAANNRFQTLQAFGPGVLTLLPTLSARSMVLVDPAGAVQFIHPVPKSTP